MKRTNQQAYDYKANNIKWRLVYLGPDGKRYIRKNNAWYCIENTYIADNIRTVTVRGDL